MVHVQVLQFQSNRFQQRVSFPQSLSVICLRAPGYWHVLYIELDHSLLLMALEISFYWKSLFKLREVGRPLASSQAELQSWLQFPQLQPDLSLNTVEVLLSEKMGVDQRRNFSLELESSPIRVFFMKAEQLFCSHIISRKISY